MKAYGHFQRCMQSNPKDTLSKKKTSPPTNSTHQGRGRVLAEFRNLNISIERYMTVDKFSKMSNAMDSVIESSNLDSVGGFKVSVVYEDGFKYCPYSKMFNENIEAGPGRTFFVHGSPAVGGYSVSFWGSSDDYTKIALHVRQGPFGIIYQRNNKGLPRPKLVKNGRS